MKRFRLFVLFLVAVLSTNYLYCAEDTDTVWMKFTHNITRLQFNNDDSKILTAGNGGIIIFDTQSGEQIKQINPSKTLDGEYSQDGSLIVTVRETPDSQNNVFPYVDIFNSTTYKLIKSIKLPQLPLEGTSRVTLSPDGRTLVVVDALGIYFIDYETGEIKKNLVKFENDKVVDAVYFVFSKDNQDLIFTGSDGKLRFINTQTYGIDYRYDAGYGFLSISNDGSMIAFKTGKSGKAVEIMNTNTHEIIGSIPGTASWVCGINFSPDGNYLAVSGPNNLATDIYQTNNWSINKTISYPQCFPAMGITNNNHFLVGGGGQRIVLLNFQTTGVLNPKENSDVLYPNPTNNQITTSFILPAPSQLNFNLYDVTGRMITRLKTGFYNAGQITENFMLGNLPNGTYLLNIESPKFNKTFQVIIQK